MPTEETFLSNIRHSARTACQFWENLHIELYVEPRRAVSVSIVSDYPYRFLTKDQFISTYFFGPFSMTDFRNMTVKIIAKAEEVAKMNINSLSSPNVYHSITLPSKKGNSGNNFGPPGGANSQVARRTFHGAGPPYRFRLVGLRGVTHPTS